MDITFNKVGELWEAEFEATADFNIHLEREKGGVFRVYQRTAGSQYALVDEVDKVNKEAEKNSDGWPSDLPDFPSGTMNSTASYRTEFTGTTMEDTKAYIETLKAEGYEYQDFYDFGMSEQDMLDMNGWWAYDGKTYLSVSYYDGIVTVDHTKELPDLSSYFG